MKFNRNLMLTLLIGTVSRRSPTVLTRAFTTTSSIRTPSFLPSQQQQHHHQRHITTTSRCSFTLQSSSSSSNTPSTSYDDGSSPYLITTPIYYVNDKPHIGHAYTSTACDVIARFMRLSGREVMFVSGTDEHGEKVQKSAATKGIPPQQFVDEVSVNFRDMTELMNISNDIFIRTTDDHHKAAVQHLWNTLVANDAIYLGAYEGWYSIRDECYYTESELIDGKAPTGSDVEWVVKEPSYFFKLSEYESRLLEWYESHPDAIAPASRRNEVISFVKGGLRDLSISRTSFDWGVKVPGDDEHVMYVWMDALTNYLSAIGYPEDNDDNVEKYWPAALHVVGKDILRFHAVYWPAFLMAAGIELPKRLFAHGWWTKDGEKISKSLGNVIDPVELVETYGVDQTRFFLMAEVGFGNDGDFSDNAMITKVNTNLANELGNLCQRTLSMVFKNCQKATPNTIGPYTPEDEALLSTIKTLRHKAGLAIAEQSLQNYVQVMVSAVWETNKYVDDMAPWALKKTDPERMNTVLYVLMEVLRRVAILYQPLIPKGAGMILDQLGVGMEERTFGHLETSPVKMGVAIEKPKVVFPRIEMPALQELVDA